MVKYKSFSTSPTCLNPQGTMRPYAQRIVDSELDILLAELPAVVLEGPKAVGKTATAARRVATVFELDTIAHRQLAQADPSVLLNAPAPVLFDEWQHVPAIWDAVRRRVDAGAEPGQYLLAGSAVSTDAPTHSGAGRIVSVRMRPLALAERGLVMPTVSLRDLLTGARPPLGGTSTMALSDYADEVLASGFPGLRGLSERALKAQLDGYLQRIADRDFVDQGHAVRKPVALRRWMTAYAAATATTTSLAKIRDAATAGAGETASKPTTAMYRDVLESLWVLDPVPAWSPTHGKLARLVQAPRHHLVDPALAARLLGVDRGALLHGDASSMLPNFTPKDGALLGQLFESLVTLSVRVCAQASSATVSHFREHDGRREIDLIVEREDRRVIAIEVKLSATVDDADVRHLLWLQGRLKDDLLDALIVTTGSHAYRRADGIGVIPAALLTA